MMTQRRAKLEPNRSTDAELIARLAKGEIGALGELYDRHHEVVRRFIRRTTGGAEDVDDLVHHTFLAAAKSASRFDGRSSSCRPWLLGIAVHHLRQRRQAFARLFSFLGSLRSRLASSVDPRATLDARSDIDGALAKLSEPKRVTFLLAEVEGCTCAEIAESLDVPIGTVWTRLHAARRELRELLQATEQEGEQP